MRNFFSNNLFYTTTINKIVRNNNSEVVLFRGRFTGNFGSPYFAKRIVPWGNEKRPF